MFNPFGGMSCLSVLTPQLATFRPRGRRAARRARLAHAQTVLPELLVVSPSLVPIEASKTGSSVTAMTGEEARASGFSQLSDVMRTFPGMHVNQSGSRGSLTQFRVRGAEANHLLVMIDGVAANAVGDGEYNFADFPMDDIERIELLRGPQSGLYGANAHSGVLTIVTKSGRGLQAGIQRALRGRHATSAEGSPRRSAARSARSMARSPHARDDRGFNVARDGSERDGAKRTVVTAKAGVDLTPYFNVEGFLRHSSAECRYDPQDPFFTTPAWSRTRRLFRPTSTRRQARVEGTVKLFDDRWIQSVKWTGSRTISPATSRTSRKARSSLGTAETLSYKSSLLLDSAVLGGEKHRITGLVENRREHFSFFDSIFLFGPDLDAARNGYTRTSTGVGGEYVLDLLATGTTVSAAVRQDFNEPFEDELTWRFSLSQKVAPIGGRLHASVGRGVTNPSFIEQFGFISSFFVPNAEPDPGKLGRLGRRLGADLLERPRRHRRDLFQFAAGERDRSASSAPAFKSTCATSTGTRPARASRRPASSVRSTG